MRLILWIPISRGRAGDGKTAISGAIRRRQQNCFLDVPQVRLRNNFADSLSCLLLAVLFWSWARADIRTHIAEQYSWQSSAY